METTTWLLIYSVLALALIAADFWARRKIEFYNRYFPFGERAKKIAEWERARRVWFVMFAVITAVVLFEVVK